MREDGVRTTSARRSRSNPPPSRPARHQPRLVDRDAQLGQRELDGFDLNTFGATGGGGPIGKLRVLLHRAFSDRAVLGHGFAVHPAGPHVSRHVRPELHRTPVLIAGTTAINAQYAEINTPVYLPWSCDSGPSNPTTLGCTGRPGREGVITCPSTVSRFRRASPSTRRWPTSSTPSTSRGSTTHRHCTAGRRRSGLVGVRRVIKKGALRPGLGRNGDLAQTTVTDRRPGKASLLLVDVG